MKKAIAITVTLSIFAGLIIFSIGPNAKKKAKDTPHQLRFALKGKVVSDGGTYGQVYSSVAHYMELALGDMEFEGEWGLNQADPQHPGTYLLDGQSHEYLLWADFSFASKADTLTFSRNFSYLPGLDVHQGEALSGYLEAWFAGGFKTPEGRDLIRIEDGMIYLEMRHKHFLES